MENTVYVHIPGLVSARLLFMSWSEFRGSSYWKHARYIGTEEDTDISVYESMGVDIATIIEY
ncbi:MAG: hypothetical protein LBI19_02905 [Oscillospiraceae bacterium]|jgi:hypothetical protein|nr:hypothetical protein [Oscillospiraceae bacterium]